MFHHIEYGLPAWKTIYKYWGTIKGQTLHLLMNYTVKSNTDDC